jgi:ribosomal protein L32
MRASTESLGDENTRSTPNEGEQSVEHRVCLHSTPVHRLCAACALGS